MLTVFKSRSCPSDKVSDNLIRCVREQQSSILSRARHLYGFQPPYSPEANPIEEGFSLLKSHLRGWGARGLPELRRAIEQGLKLWTQERIDGWLRHTIVQISMWPSDEPYPL